MMTQLEQMTAKVAKFCMERDWDQFHGPKDLAIALVTEASEVLELFRFQNEEESLAMFEDSERKAAIEDELADTFFFLLRFAHLHKIDLEAAVTNKLAKNALKYPVDKARGNNRKYDQL